MSLKAISIIVTGPQELLNNRVPGVLIARLGVDLNWQGLGIGRTLLRHALETSIEVSQKVGIKLVAIEPYSSELCGYYERFGFEALGSASRMMVMKISKIKKAKLS